MSNWIAVSERLPTREDAKDAGEVLAVDARGHQWLWEFREYPADMFGLPPVAWMPIPRYTPPKPGPTDTECKELIYRITNEAWDESAVMEWFADVTARIERERGQ